MAPATAPNGQSLKKYGKQILNGASNSGGNLQVGGPQRPAARPCHENAARAWLRGTRTGDDGKAALVLVHSTWGIMTTFLGE